MKAIKLLLIASIVLTSCSNDDDKKNCNCEGEWRHPGETMSYYGPTEVDCDTGEALSTPPGNPDSIFMGCTD